MEVVEFGALDEATRAELEGDEDDPFDAARLDVELAWRPKERHVALRNDQGRLVASAGLLVAGVTPSTGDPLAVVGLGGVFVNHEHRGLGLASRVLVEALRVARTLGPELIMLFCHSDRVGLYARHRFAVVTAPVFVQQPAGWVRMPMLAMWRALRGDTTLAAGEIRVDGLPF